MSLHDIQTAVHVAKDKRNEFGGYNYRTAEGILAAAKAALPDGATIVVSDALQEVAGRIFVSATATIKLADGVEYSATGHAMHALQKKGMDDAQITGACSSYARKYALAGLLALDDGSADPDSKDNRNPEKTERDWFAETLPNVKDADGINALLGRAKAAGRDVAKLLVDRATELGLDYDSQSRRYVYIEEAAQ